MPTLRLRDVAVTCDSCSQQLGRENVFPHWLTRHTVRLRSYAQRLDCDGCGYVAIGSDRLFTHFSSHHADFGQPGWAALANDVKIRNDLSNEKAKNRRNVKTRPIAYCDVCRRGFANHTCTAAHFASCHPDLLGAGWLRYTQQLTKKKDASPLICDVCFSVWRCKRDVRRHFLPAHLDRALKAPKRVSAPGTFGCDECQNSSTQRGAAFCHFVRRHASSASPSWRRWKEALARMEIARYSQRRSRMAKTERRGHFACDACEESRGTRDALYRHFVLCHAVDISEPGMELNQDSTS